MPVKRLLSYMHSTYRDAFLFLACALHNTGRHCRSWATHSHL